MQRDMLKGDENEWDKNVPPILNLNDHENSLPFKGRVRVGMGLNPEETLEQMEDVKIIQKKDGYRFNTDSILLSKLSSPKKYSKVLELGTGCGVVSLLLYRKAPTIHITAVELQKDLAELAERNVVLNNLTSHISILHKDIKELPKLFPSAHFDHIITNPPYRTPSSGRTGAHKGKAISNKELTISLREIMKVSRYLLKMKGRFSIIYPVERLADLIIEMRTHRIEPKEIHLINAGNPDKIRFAWIEGAREGKPGMKCRIIEYGRR
ncbi:MAG: methyltransferase [Nitrospirae bacterium]|nr:methyltransferase [Nitrospirota bacterium]